MAKEKKEVKSELEREYIVPLRKRWLKAPRHKRAKKAVRALKEFIAKHMKVEEREIRKVKLDQWLNNEMWYRGIKKPPAKIKVKAKKMSDGTVLVELAEIPAGIKFKVEKQKKLKEASEDKKKKKVEAKPVEEKKEETVEEKKEKEEKKESVEEAAIKQAKQAKKVMKHEAGGKKVQIQRKALKK